MKMIKTKLVSEKARLPERANPDDAGADLFSPVFCIILPLQSVEIDFGIQMEIPSGYAGFIFARSGLGSRGIRPRNCVGVIDSKYRGNIKIKLENHQDMYHIVDVGDRIAQIVILPVSTEEFVAVDKLDMDGDRGGGFGSSGK
jgi:dUTP pyrophosphatase